MDERKMRIWTKDFSLLLTSNMFYSVALYMLMPMIPLYIVSLGGSDTEVGLVASAFSISSIAMRFSINLLFTRTPKKTLLLAGTALTALVVVIYFLFQSVGGVCAARIIQGFGFGVVTTIGSAMAADILPESRRGEGIGYYLMATSAMMAASPAIGLFLAKNYGYLPMLMAAAVGPVIALAFSSFLTKRPAPEVSASEKTGKLSWLDCFFDKRLLIHTVLLILMGVNRGADSNFIALFAQENGIAHLSWYYVLQTAATFAMRGAIGNITDRKGLKWSFIPGAIAAFGFLFLISVTHTTAQLMLAGLLSGIGLGTLIPSMQTWMFSSVDPEKSNLASAMFFNFYDIGIGLGSIALGYLAGELGYAVMFRVASFSQLLFLAIYLLYGKRKKAPEGE